MPFNSIFSWVIKKRNHQIDLFKEFPHETQEEVLNKLIHFSRLTEWGKSYGYSQLKSYDQYRKTIPIQDYDDVKSYVHRMKQGEQNLLWPTEIKWFAKSSGTTSDKSKFIPVSREALEDCHYKGGKDLLGLYYRSHPKTRLFNGKHLIVGGSATINHLNDDKNSYWGDLSAIIIKNLPVWVELRRTPSRSIALMEKWEDKIDKMAYSTMQEDVHILAGVPSWTMVLLNRILEISGKDNIHEVWPNLELFMHGGVNFTPYEEQYKKLIPKPNMNYVETYNASEGFFGIQDGEKKELLLMLDYGIFYEFIDMDEYYSDDRKAIPLWEVQLNKNYAVIITTNAGLWRYNLGDTIKFTSSSPYRFVITGRTKHFINAFGEELIIDNAEKAIAKACERTNSIVKEYTAGPIYMTDQNKGGHEWLIEFETPPESLSFFTEVLDNNLKALNSDYEAKRSKNLTLQLPYVRMIPSGTFYAWMKNKNKLGGQHKVPRLSNNRKYLDEIIEFIQCNQKSKLHA